MTKRPFSPKNPPILNQTHKQAIKTYNK